MEITTNSQISRLRGLATKRDILHSKTQGEDIQWAIDRIIALENRSILYEELIYQIANKTPNETRHETALRYIKQAEERCNGPAQAANKKAAEEN